MPDPTLQATALRYAAGDLTASESAAFEARPPREPGVAAGENATACDGGDPRSVAEIWADLSTHDNVEKARDDELRWRQRVRDPWGLHQASAPARPSAG